MATHLEILRPGYKAGRHSADSDWATCMPTLKNLGSVPLSGSWLQLSVKVNSVMGVGGEAAIMAQVIGSLPFMWGPGLSPQLPALALAQLNF